MGISTHVLDTSRGRPAAGVGVSLERSHGDAWESLGSADTDADGRVNAFAQLAAPPRPGTYRLRFEVGAYFAAAGGTSFYPRVEITFTVTDGAGHHHVPLLLSPFGYSTYRGS